MGNAINTFMIAICCAYLALMTKDVQNIKSYILMNPIIEHHKQKEAALFCRARGYNDN